MGLVVKTQRTLFCYGHKKFTYAGALFVSEQNVSLDNTIEQFLTLMMIPSPSDMIPQKMWNSPDFDY